MNHNRKYELMTFRDRVLRKIVWHLPSRLVFWAAIRVTIHSTTGKYRNQVVPELKAVDALKHWEDDNKL